MSEGVIKLLAGFTHNRHLLILTIALVTVAGISAFLTLPRIEDPRITTRNAVILTPFPGASAARVEALVTKKIEDRLRELSEIKTIESTSRNGVSAITIALQDRITSVNNEQVFSKVRDRLSEAAGELPEEAGRPEFDDMRGAVAYSMIIALSGNTTPGTLKRLAEQLGDKMRNLSGTEQVTLFGAPAEEILVDVNAQELAALGLSPAALATRIAAADARRSAGVVHNSFHNLTLELDGALDSAARVAAVPLAVNGRGGLVSVGDIATVQKQWHDPPEQIALHEGRQGVLLAVRTEGEIRLDRWARAAHAAVSEFREGLDSGIRVETVFDQNRYTQQRLGGLGSNLIAGAAVVMVVVFFMMGWRAALIVGSALPLSAGATLFGLTLFGEPIHQMSIFGMIIAIGLLIDNAIIMSDKIIAYRRAGTSATEAVKGAIGHLFTPLLASTLTTVLGFMPIFLLPGNVGDFVSPIAIAVVLALIASFFLSMTVIPALAGRLGHGEQCRDRRWWRDGMSSAWLGTEYRRLLWGSLRRPGLTLVLTTLLPVTGFALAGNLGMEFFPPADRDQIEIKVWMPSGTAIGYTTKRLRSIEATIREYSGIRQITWVAGADSPPVYYNQLRLEEHRPEYARGVIRVTDPSTARVLEARLQDELTERYPDVQVVVKAFGQGPPIAAPVSFRIVGPSPDRLRLLGEQLRAVLHQLPQVTHTRASVLGGEPKLLLAADEQQARLAGLALGEIAGQFQAAFDGRIGGRILESLEDLPVRVRYEYGDRDSLADVGGLPLSVPHASGWIPAVAFGDLTLKPVLSGITRYNGERVNQIHAYLRQGSLPIEVTRIVEARVASGALELPPGYRIDTAGDSAEQQRAVGQLLAYAPVLAMLMLSSLVLSFRSFTLAGLIGIVAVFSVGLGMLSLWASGYPLGFNPIIGSAGLIGVAINASIVVLAAIRANPEACAGGVQGIVDETIDATRHIVSTTLTTVAGFMPLLLFSGGNFWPPLAVVIAGGVALSAALSLFFTPAAYSLLCRARLISPSSP